MSLDISQFKVISNFHYVSNPWWVNFLSLSKYLREATHKEEGLFERVVLEAPSPGSDSSAGLASDVSNEWCSV